MVSTDNSALFREPPLLHANGSLTYALAKYESGTARFSAVIEDDGGVQMVGGNRLGDNRSTMHMFEMVVDRINHRPTFLASDVFATQDMPEQELIFAEAVSPGAPAEARQTLTWHFEYTNPQLFESGPNLSVALLTGGGIGGAGLYGVLRFRSSSGVAGSSNFTVWLADDGPDDSAVSGEGNVSAPQTFELVVRRVNQVHALNSPAVVLLTIFWVPVVG